jgi:elongation factor 1-alpha
MRIKLPKEGGNIEFKEFLSPDTHLKRDKKQKLAAQMKNRLENGKGKSIYVIGVTDSGKIKGLTNFEFEQTLNVLKIIAEENNAKIVKVERFEEDGKLIGKILIERIERPKFKQHIVVGVAGHVGSGKSTLIATLITGKADKEGKNWLYLNVLPHEIERGLTADLHYTFLAFSNGEPIHFKNPLDKREKNKLIKRAERIVSFVDNVGHEVWLRTILRGLVGQNLDYGILVVDAVDGITRCTKEDLGIMLAMNLPVIACITKIDKTSKRKLENLEKEVCTLLKNVGKVPYIIRSEKDIPIVGDKIEIITPIIETSAYNLEGYDLFYKLLSILPEREKPVHKPFLMYIDKVYNISGVGCVVSGCIMQGRLEVGKKLLLGPINGSGFREVKVKSIEMHYSPLSKAEAGLLVGIALKGVKHEEVKRGMIVCDRELKPRAVKSFEAEILVLNHPTKISDGYEPVLHLNTIASTVKLKMVDKKYLKAGESGKVVMTFKYKPQSIRENDKFVFREGKTKGIGTVLRILK